MRVRLVDQPVRWAVSRRAIVLGVLILLGGLATLGEELGWPARLLDGSTSSYARRVDALRTRHEASLSKLTNLLNERDANPTLVGSEEWKQQFAGAVDDLGAEYTELRAVTPPPNARATHACLENSFRLTAEGASLLAQGFAIDGHGAYFFGSHGNWDLNLGSEQLLQCGAAPP